MKDLFSIKQASEIVHMTSETLRHYDRIGLVKPCHTDESSGYRYYSEQELVQLQTVELLKTMDLSLKEIKDILQKNDLSQIIALLKQAEKNADHKIAQLQNAKSRIRRAYTDYESKLDPAQNVQDEFFITHMPERVILLSDRMERTTLKNLWGYFSHFYKQVGEPLQSQYEFEDQAGMITVQGKTRLFAICLKYPSKEGLTVVLEGDYLCANCTEENEANVREKLLHTAKSEYGVIPDTILHSIVVTGILRWSYQIQVLIG